MDIEKQKIDHPTGIELNIIDQHMDGMLHGPRYQALEKLLKAYKHQKVIISQQAEEIATLRELYSKSKKMLEEYANR